MGDHQRLVRLDRHEGGVIEWVLDRPEAMNAVSTEMAEALVAAGEELAADRSVRAVVVTSSSEKAFCVGADLKERNGLTDDQLREQRPGNRRAYRALLELPVPTIAVVDGYALGGGCELALACDLIVAGRRATLALPEVGVGVIPGGGGTQLMTRRIGWSRAADLIFTGRRVDADEAYRLGLVDRVEDDPRTAAMELAGQIAANSPIGVRNAKAAMRAGLDVSLDEGLDIEDERWHDTAFSADRAEGVRAFAEKRRPRWPGLR
ncbi:enoyl-CoA hydratase/isomerase family protein [Marihabitans asiaticum]|uniref:enoyl-CoA hydratase n=1 Tax=Marihabitans asiaticum TaxID=415218 RepID=A0A560WI09_9MICO|nr:enoyl-CoA hydratase-related protein [Marihabitans asiaticum]TWD17337.1 enoyl-CoA hydratase/carnithine racemase [Marihabitans asiaticum]